MVKAEDTHSWLGILDRRVQLLRNMIPKLAEELASECIEVEPDDLVAEAEYCLNSHLLYGGYSPYECLYGCQPSPVFWDETEHLGQLGTDSVSFFEHAAVRAKAIAHFHQSLLATGLARVNTSRPRSDEQRTYKVGEWVDCWRKPKNKDRSGWRGPCVIINLLGEGMLTVRWQGVYMDIPVHHARPHLTSTPTATLNATGPPVPALIAPPAAAAIADVSQAPAGEEPLFVGIVDFEEQAVFLSLEESDTDFEYK